MQNISPLAVLNGALWLFSAFFFFFFLLNPPIYTLHLSQEGVLLEIWPNLDFKTYRWVIIATALLLPVCSAVLHYLRTSRAEHEHPSGQERLLSVLSPLGLLPLGVIPLFLADMLDPFIRTNLTLLIGLGAIALFLTRLITPWLNAQRSNTRRGLGLRAVLLLVGSTTFYIFAGIYFSGIAGEHVGDEGHYIIQAQSLYEDRNLDLRNNIFDIFGSEFVEERGLGFFHIAPNSKEPHWYSWHPYGLSLLIAPFWEWGTTGRHLVLGLISGLGLTGLYLVCRRIGAGNPSSLLVVLSLGTSVFWAVYSFRALPEVLGGTLLIWTFWAIIAQKDRPWTTLLIAALCCGFMPFAQTRFIPMSLMGIGLYGLFGLLGDETLRRKISRLSIFSLLCALAYGLYLALQTSMFTGASSYPISDVLFSYPMGAWATLASERGLVQLFPVLFWLFGAMLAWFVMDPKHRLLCLGLALTFLACLLTSNTYHGYTGGSSLPGRYLVAVVPLLFPAAAIVLERSGSFGRFWFLFLSLFSTLLLAATFFHLPDIGRGFILPLHSLTSMPLLHGLFFPHATITLPMTPEAIWTTVYVIVGFFATTSILFLEKRSRAIAIGSAVLILTIGVFSAQERGRPWVNYPLFLHAIPQEQVDFVTVREPLEHRLPWHLPVNVANLHAFTGQREAREDMVHRVARSNDHAAGMMGFGHYQQVFPGEFFVEFVLDAQGAPTREPLATLDITTDEGRKTLAREVVGPTNGPRVFALDVHVNDYLLLEPRVEFHGFGEVRLSEIVICERLPHGPDPTPNLTFKNAPMEAIRQILPAYLFRIDLASISHSPRIPCIPPEHFAPDTGGS
ncbi:MAG: hypothetical protein EA399_03995 [Desulfovibrionales bacterium]|nr:MAG: hypothetical protein EA399_03995 [Desulfovibrionales bacterium]